LDGKGKIFISVDPGVCGFECIITAQKDANNTVEINIIGSKCKKIQRLSKIINTITLEEMFLPFTQNPLFLSMENVKCHISCPLSTAILKSAEVAFGLAVPKPVKISFIASKER